MSCTGSKYNSDTGYADSYCVVCLFIEYGCIFPQIMRAIINSDGSVVGPFCVVSFTMGTVTHLAIDPNHG